MEVSSLTIPRVEVYWGPVNLTSPTKTPAFYANLKGLKNSDLESVGPLVYDVRVGMEDQGQTPSGSFKWNPTGLGFEVYEKMLKEYIDYSIMINFYYVTGGFIPFEFYWGGQSDTYGKDMELTVKLVTLMDGLVNANMYATAQADKEEKGESHKTSVSNVEKLFGVKDYNLIQYTQVAEKDMGKAVVKANYNDGSNFMDAVQNIVKDNGNNVFFNNIGKANALVYTPYTWEIESGFTSLSNPASRRAESGPTPPDPKQRYYYFLGPEIIQSFSRNYEWQPPQKSQEISAVLGKKPESKKSQAAQNQRSQAIPDKQQERGQSQATAPQGVHSAKGASSNIRSVNNGDGPKKQDKFTKERAAKLSTTLFMCPALVGIKPLDILLVGNYTGSFLEDWIVSTVEYQQTQGGVDISIQATRPFGLSKGGLGVSMNPNLVSNISSGLTLEDWNHYAWVHPLPYRGKSSPSVTGTQFTPPTSQDKAPFKEEEFQKWFKENYPDINFSSLDAESQEMLRNSYKKVVLPTVSSPSQQPPAPQALPPAVITTTPQTPQRTAAPLEPLAAGTYRVTNPQDYARLKELFSKSTGVGFDDAKQLITGLDESGVNVVKNVLGEYGNLDTVPALPPGSPTPVSSANLSSQVASPALQAIGPNLTKVNDSTFLGWIGRIPDFNSRIDYQSGVIRNVVPSQIQYLYEEYKKLTSGR